MLKMKVTIPQGLHGGMPLVFRTATGRMQTTIPQGLQEGQSFEIMVPSPHEQQVPTLAPLLPAPRALADGDRSRETMSELDAAGAAKRAPLNDAATAAKRAPLNDVLVASVRAAPRPVPCPRPRARALALPSPWLVGGPWVGGSGWWWWLGVCLPGPSLVECSPASRATAFRQELDSAWYNSAGQRLVHR